MRDETLLSHRRDRSNRWGGDKEIHEVAGLAFVLEKILQSGCGA